MKLLFTRLLVVLFFCGVAFGAYSAYAYLHHHRSGGDTGAPVVVQAPEPARDAGDRASSIPLFGIFKRQCAAIKDAVARHSGTNDAPVKAGTAAGPSNTDAHRTIAQLDDSLRLKAIFFSAKAPTAVINQETFAVGETHDVQTRKGWLTVECRRITPESVFIRVADQPETELRLRQH